MRSQSSTAAAGRPSLRRASASRWRVSIESSTARSLKVKNPFDPEQNVDAGVRHLKQLLESYGGDVNLTLAAYNAGSGAVARSAGVPRYAETQNYVRRITNLYYGGFNLGPSLSRDPVRVKRDARGVLYISNTE